MRAPADFDEAGASDAASVRSDEPSLPGVAGIPPVIFGIGSCLSAADLAQLDRTAWWISAELRWHIRAWSPVHSESDDTPRRAG